VIGVEVAIAALASGVVDFISMRAEPRFLDAALAVVAGIAHVLGVMLLISVRAARLLHSRSIGEVVVLIFINIQHVHFILSESFMAVIQRKFTRAIAFSRRIFNDNFIVNIVARLGIIICSGVELLDYGVAVGLEELAEVFDGELDDFFLEVLLKGTEAVADVEVVENAVEATEVEEGV
jgi:hypothetical protein